MLLYRSKGLPLNPQFSWIILLIILVITNGSIGLAQELWEGSKFIEYPDAELAVTTSLPQHGLATFAYELQPKRKKCKLENDKAILEMSFVVYESAAIGNKPFGRIRYKLHLREEGNQLIWSFQDFTFKKIERSPRYAKLEEVGGKPKEIYLAQGELTPNQWKIVRWKTDVVINRKMDSLIVDERQAIGMP